MALPTGASTATITAGGSVGVAGTAATVSELTVALDLPAAHGSRSGSPRLVWGATGVGIESIAERPAAPVTDSLTVLADQPGVLASSTVNGQPALVEIRGWPMVARWRVTMGNESRVHVRRFSASLLAPGTTVDLDMLPEAGVPTPATVTYAQTINIGGGASSAITADDTPAAPAEGESASYFVTSAVVWPAGLVWSTDPDGGVAPTIAGTALVSMFTVGGTTRAILGATFPALPDTVVPVAGTLAASSITETGFTLSVSGASDAGSGLHYDGPYSFSTDNGATWGPWQAVSATVVTGKTGGTSYQCQHRVRDNAGNETTGASITVSTVAGDTTAPTWTATFTLGTPTETSVVATASALATDNVGVTGYEVSYNDGSTWAAITPSGSNFTLTGTAGTTYATTKLRAKDAAGNYSTPVLSVPSYTMAASSDVTAPTVGTMAASAITATGFTLTVSSASDETALHATPYAFTTDGGTTWTAYQASAVLAVTGKAAETGYSCNWRVRDAAGNVSTGTAQTVTTGATLLAFVTSATTPTDATSHTFSGVSFGAEAAARQVIVALNYTGGGAEGTVPTITIGGVSATIDYSRTDGTVGRAVIARATVPTGTTGDVVVAYPATCYRAGIGVYRSGTALAPTAGVSSNTGTKAGLATATITNPTGGTVVACAITVAVPVSWTGATQDYVTEAESTVWTTSASTTTEGALTITPAATGNGSDSIGAVAYTAA